MRSELFFCDRCQTGWVLQIQDLPGRVAKWELLDVIEETNRARKYGRHVAGCAACLMEEE